METNSQPNTKRNPKRGRTVVSRALMFEEIPAADSPLKRRSDEIASAVVSDMGGAAQCSAVRMHLINNFSASAAIAEILVAKLANGDEINLGDYVALGSNMVRFAARIGVTRVPRDVQTLDEYLREHYGSDRQTQEPQEVEG